MDIIEEILPELRQLNVAEAFIRLYLLMDRANFVVDFRQLKETFKIEPVFAELQIRAMLDDYADQLQSPRKEQAHAALWRIYTIMNHSFSVTERINFLAEQFWDQVQDFRRPINFSTYKNNGSSAKILPFKQKTQKNQQDI